MRYTIASTRLLGPAVREFRLVPADGSATPAWRPGDQVELAFRSKAGERYCNACSLVGVPGPELHIAVQLEAGGRGRSHTLHEEVEAGVELDLEGPLGGFALHPGAMRTVLLAGGFGITPLVSMARALAARGQDFELHYLARGPEHVVLLDALRALATGEVTVHLTGAGKRPDLAHLIGPWQQGCELRTCGPAGLLEAVRDCATAPGWPPACVHVESFGARRQTGDGPVRLHLRQSGMTLEVEPGTSLLEAMIAADALLAHDCRRGECGQCFAQVLSGTPQQRSQGMTSCVSWAAGTDLELDL